MASETQIEEVAWISHPSSHLLHNEIKLLLIFHNKVLSHSCNPPSSCSSSCFPHSVQSFDTFRLLLFYESTFNEALRTFRRVRCLLRRKRRGERESDRAVLVTQKAFWKTHIANAIER